MKFTIRTNALICLIIFVLSGMAYAQTHFTPPQETPFLPMTIFIVGATANGQNIVAGTEVGAFTKSKPDVCVGAAVLTGAVNPSNPVQLIASKAEGENGGFNDGDSMVFKLWDPAIQREYVLDSDETQYYDSETGLSIDPVTYAGLETAVINIDLRTYIDVDNTSMSHQPESCRLYRNYPNPFNPSTTIVYEIPEDTDLRIDVYNIRGTLVNTLYQGKQRPGRFTLTWDAVNAQGKRVTSGVYLLVMSTTKFKKCQKILLAK